MDFSSCIHSSYIHMYKFSAIIYSVVDLLMVAFWFLAGVYSLPSSDRDDANYSTSGLQRVFLHSSSINYSNASFRGSNFLLYGERQRMVVHSSSGPNPNYKIILRDVTEVSAFALLFFGGRLESKFLDGTILVDGWIRLALLLPVSITVPHPVSLYLSIY